MVKVVIMASASDQLKKTWFCLGETTAGNCAECSNIVQSSHFSSRDGVVVRALASHQCGPGSILRSSVSYGLSLLVLFPALRGFSPGTPVFPLPKNQHFSLTAPKLTALKLLLCINKVSLPLPLTLNFAALVVT